MRVLTISNLYPPHAYGGYEWTCFDTMQRFRERGHDVLVLTSDARVEGVAEPDSHRVERSLAPWWDWKWQVPIDGAPNWVMRREARNNLRVRRLIKQFRPDVVSVWHMGGLGLSLLASVERARLPTVVVIEDDWLVYGPQRDPWRKVHQDSQWLRIAGPLAGIPRRNASLAGARMLFCSAFTAERGRRADAWRLRPGEIEPLGVDTRAFPIVSPREKQWRWRLLYVGRMQPQKGIDTLLRAFAELPSSASLELVGSGNEGFRAAMIELAISLGVAGRVTFAAVPRGDLAEKYRAADAVIFPSEWDEPFGIVPLESMACATPVIASGTGGSGEFLESGVNCLLFRPGDVGDLVKAITTLAEDAALRRRLVTGGTATAERLTVDRFAGRMLEIHEEAAGAHRHGRLPPGKAEENVTS